MATEKRAYTVYVEAVVLPQYIARGYTVYVEVVVGTDLVVTDMWQVQLITGAG